MGLPVIAGRERPVPIPKIRENIPYREHGSESILRLSVSAVRKPARSLDAGKPIIKNVSYSKIKVNLYN